MNHSLGANPVEYPLMLSSKVCGSCHSVVLPVFDGDKPWVRPGDEEARGHHRAGDVPRVGVQRLPGRRPDPAVVPGLPHGQQLSGPAGHA